MIVFDSVSKKYPLGNHALDNVSFSIENNEFVFLVGPSGAGKTTILKLICRELQPSGGNITIDNESISKKSYKNLITLRRKIGFVFQDFKILTDKNIYENIALGMQVTGAPPSAIKREVRETLKLVNLSNKEKLFPVQLSAGELQRVAIARALCGQRNLILADEPTGNLDIKTTWEIIKIFKKIEGKRTIIIATHNADIVNSLNKRVLLLKDGKLVKDTKKGRYEI